MTSASLVVAAAVALSLGVIGSCAGCAAPEPDDRGVLAAVIVQRLLPKALATRQDQPDDGLLVLLPTAHPFCEPTEQHREQCLDPHHLDLPELFGQHSRSGRGVLGFPDGAAAQLAAALSARNVGGPPLPALEHPRVRSQDLSASSPQQATTADHGLGTIMLSLPAHDGSGDAVVLATYHCGPLCGYTWLFRVTKQAQRWTVVAESQVSVS